MNTLDEPIWSKYSIAVTYLARSDFQRMLSKKDGSRVGMNVTAHQEKKKNKETKMGMKKAREGRRYATDFRKAVHCPSAVVQGAARQKKWFVRWECQGKLGPSEKPQPFRPNPNGVGNRITMLRRLLIGADMTRSQVFSVIPLFKVSILMRWTSGCT